MNYEVWIILNRQYSLIGVFHNMVLHLYNPDLLEGNCRLVIKWNYFSVFRTTGNSSTTKKKININIFAN